MLKNRRDEIRIEESLKVKTYVLSFGYWACIVAYYGIMMQSTLICRVKISCRKDYVLYFLRTIYHFNPSETKSAIDSGKRKMNEPIIYAFMNESPNSQIDPKNS